MSPAAQRILRTAAELIAVRGYAATTTRDIAAAVGVQQPAIYKHFSAKDDILAALVRLGLEHPLAVADELVSLDVRAAAKLYRWLAEALAHLHDSPYVLASILTTPDLFVNDRFAAERELVDRIDGVITHLVTDAQREGDVRPIDPVSASRLVQSLFDALAVPEMSVTPAEILKFAMIGLLTDAAALPEIRFCAETLTLPAS